MATLPNTATKAELAEAHRNKMAWKRDERARAYAYARRAIAAEPLANLSRRHPDHGLTVSQHNRQKAMRAGEPA